MLIWKCIIGRIATLPELVLLPLLCNFGGHPALPSDSGHMLYRVIGTRYLRSSTVPGDIGTKSEKKVVT